MPDVSKIWPVQVKPLDSVTPHPENFREHDIGAIAHSIELWGVWRPLVIQQSTNFVIVGCGEWKALAALHRSEAPMYFMDVDDRNARAILLADNWIPSRGRNMPEELLQLMQELREDADLFTGTGADDDDVEALERELEEADKPLKLDSRKMVRKRKVTCPECGHKFEIGGKT
jgi:ParB-like chromosome segregation protein Spo0J